VTTAPDETWLRPIDLMSDSDAPEQIADELGRRHAHYLREAQRLVLEGNVPDETGLADGIRAETRRYLASHEWLRHATLAPAVAAAEERTLASLHEVVAAAARPQPAPSRPVRRLALEPAATIVGNMGLRKRRTDAGVELSWDAAANVVEWAVRISSRPDPRGDYEELAELSLPGSATSLAVELDENPRRIQLTGVARGDRTVRRVTVSALTRGNSGAQWKRQASAG
jgi:hypothetical protein